MSRIHNVPGKSQRHPYLGNLWVHTYRHCFAPLTWTPRRWHLSTLHAAWPNYVPGKDGPAEASPGTHLERARSPRWLTVLWLPFSSRICASIRTLMQFNVDTGCRSEKCSKCQLYWSSSVARGGNGFFIGIIATGAPHCMLRSRACSSCMWVQRHNF